MKILLENDIFKPASEKEIKARQVAYRDIKIKEYANEIKRRGTLNPDGTYDFKGNVDISGLEVLEDIKLTSIEQLGIKFGKVKGYFDCGDNYLTTLEGAPKEVGKSFYCYHNRLTSLEGAPSIVGKGFYCYINKLTTLIGAPNVVNGDFQCYANKLTTLEGAPSIVRKEFDCSANNLTSLVGAPKEVGGDFICDTNKRKFTEEQVSMVSKVSGDIVV